MSVEDTYRLLFLEISLKPTDLKKFILKVLSLEILQYRFLIFKSSLAYLIIFFKDNFPYPFDLFREPEINIEIPACDLVKSISNKSTKPNCSSVSILQITNRICLVCSIGS